MVLTAAAEKTYKLLKTTCQRQLNEKRVTEIITKLFWYLLLLLLFRLIVFGLWFSKIFSCFHVVFLKFYSIRKIMLCKNNL